MFFLRKHIDRGRKFIRRNGRYIALALAITLIALGSVAPTRAAGMPGVQHIHTIASQSSFSIDLSGLLTTASQLFNGLFPVFGPIIGITLAFGIIGFIINEIRRAI